MTAKDLEFIDRLKSQLLKPLPGEKARHRLSPPYRPQLSMEEIMARSPHSGGVMLLLYVKNADWHLVFIERRKYDGVHSGQISFPGGKKEEEESSLIHTALRETEEEVGVHRNKIHVVGGLTELYIPPSNFLVQPYIGYAEGRLAFVPHDMEVAEIVEIPVSFFLDHKNISPETKISLNNGVIVTVPAYIYDRHIIWGATAIILAEFVEVVKQIERG